MRADTPTPRAHMDVTPMLDVLLVIIVVFLLVQMQSIWPSMYAQTPEPCRQGCGGTSSLVLEVGPPDRYAINGETLPFARLGARLAELLGARNDKALFVKGDSGVTYDHVMSAIDAARGAGATVIGIVPKEVSR
jgi:biopolymer transport protein TolR